MQPLYAHNAYMKLCKTCREPIRGRSDKKFCSDHCRTHWHNEQNRMTSACVRTINQALRRNRRILLRCSEGKKKPSRSMMISLGYDFNLFTGMAITVAGQSVYICYDIGFVIEADLSVSIAAPSDLIHTNYFQESMEVRHHHFQQLQPSN